MSRTSRSASAVLGIALAVGGCVTVPPPGYRPQSLTVSTHAAVQPRLGWGAPQGPLEEVPGVLCTATNDRGSWSVVTPGVVAVERSAARLRITCRRDGFREASVDLPCAVPGSQAAAAMPLAAAFPPALLILLPATAIGTAAAANREPGEPNFCLYGAGNTVQVVIER